MSFRELWEISVTLAGWEALAERTEKLDKEHLGSFESFEVYHQGQYNPMWQYEYCPSGAPA